MTDKDFPAFCQMWGQTYELFNRQLSDGAFNLAFNALADLPLEVVSAALGYVVRNSKFAPTVADVRQAVSVMNGTDEHTLEQKANDVYNKLNSNVSVANDIVCDDPRAVFAFKRAFGSLKEFGAHPISADAFDRKAFVELYKNARPEWYENDPERNLIKGIYHNGGFPSVRFIGNEDTCKQLCVGIYRGMNPQLPHKRQVAQKQIECKVEAQFQTDEEFNLDDVLNELQKALTPRYRGV